MTNFDRERSEVFCGCATAVITPFKNGRIDFNAFERIVEAQIKAGVDAIVVAGTTGEAATLSEHEQMELIELCVKTVNGRIAVIAGVGGCDISKACRLAKYSSDCGADALLAVNPYYNKGNEQGIICSLNAIADSAKCPTILYNVPSRTAQSLTCSMLQELAKNERIVGMKDASGDISAVCRVMSALGDGFCIYSGNDDITVPIMSLGGRGCISVLSNIVPEDVCAMCREYLSGKVGSAAARQRDLAGLSGAMMCEVNPIPIKYAMHIMGYCELEYRLPLTAPTKKHQRLIEMAISDFMAKNG